VAAIMVESTESSGSVVSWWVCRHWQSNKG